MPVLDMEVKLPAEDVHRVIFDYIRTGHIGKKDKVKISSRPSYIEVMPDGYLWGGPVKIRITPQGDRSRIRLDVGIGIGTAAAFIASLFILMIFLLSPGIIWALILFFAWSSTWSGYTKICNRYRNKISDLLRTVERTGVIPEFKVEEEPKHPVDVDILYEKLVHRYSTVYGRGVWVIEREIQSYMKEGLSREEAIRRLAESEGLELFEEKPKPKPKPKPSLPPDILYKRLLDMYASVYGRGKPLLERKIKEYIGKGLSREEAITRLAWEEGIA